MIRSWSDLASTYENGAHNHPYRDALQAIAELCLLVSRSSLAGSLFPHTSHWKLFVGQVRYEYPPPPMPWLTVAPVSKNNIEFRYVDTPIPAKQWARVVNPPAAVERFERTIIQLGWVGSPVELRPALD